MSEDEQLLRRLNKTCEIDYICWEENHASRTAAVPGAFRNGGTATLHSLRWHDLEALPADVRSRRLVRLEFSLDLYSSELRKGTDAASQEAHVALLGDAQEFLWRRLVPWQAPHVDPRVGIWDNRLGKCVPLLKVRRTPQTTPDGQPVLRNENSMLRRTPARPRLVGGVPLNSTTWFGYEIPEGLPPATAVPQAQVRLYAKFTDNNGPLPPAGWRTRVEVTLNGLAVEQLLGASTIQAVIDGSFAKIAGPYFTPRVAVPNPEPIRKLAAGQIMLRALKGRMEQQQARLLEDVVEVGPLVAEDHDHLLRYESCSRLRQLLFQPVHDFTRTRKRRELARATGPVLPA